MEYGLIIISVLSLIGAFYLFKLYIIFLDFYIVIFESVPTWVIWLVVIFFPPFLILVISAYLRTKLANRQDENLRHIDAGFELLATGESEEAIQFLLTPALRGDSNAMLALNIAYEASGDEKEAFYWIDKAYETSPKDDYILIMLAQHYLLGIGTDKDFRMCRKLCAKIGDNTPATPESTFTVKAQSISMVASTYMSDNHAGGWDDNATGKDIQTAVELFEQSGEMGYMAAYDLLGAKLMSGEGGFPQDKERGFHYLNKAAAAGCLNSILDLFNHSIGRINDPNRFHDAYFWGRIFLLGVDDLDEIIDNIGEHIEELDKFNLDADAVVYAGKFNDADCLIYNSMLFILSDTSPSLTKDALMRFF